MQVFGNQVFDYQDLWQAFVSPRADEPIEHDEQMGCFFAWKEGKIIGCWNEEERTGYAEPIPVP